MSGIKGGAQLLLRSNNNENQDIIDMIINETDRICNLLEKVDNAYINQIHEIKKINIHEIIQHSIKVSSLSVFPILSSHDISILSPIFESLNIKER